MRKINYYDRIHKQYIELEVTDEVAKFLFANDKWLRRQQNKYNYSTISLDEPVYSMMKMKLRLPRQLQMFHKKVNY